MARRSWEEARDDAQSRSFDYFKTELRIRSGAFEATLMGVISTSMDSETGQRAVAPDGTFPVLAHISVMRADLGYLPKVNEELYVARTKYPDNERLYLVVGVDDTTDLIDIEMQAYTNDGRTGFR